MIHRKKNRPALQRRDILTVSLVFFLFFFFFFFFFFFWIGNLLKSSSTQFLVVLFFIAFYTAPFSSKHFFLGIFVRSLYTQLSGFAPFTTKCDFFLTWKAPFSLLSATFSRSLPEPSSTQLFS